MRALRRLRDLGVWVTVIAGVGGIIRLCALLDPTSEQASQFHPSHQWLGHAAACRSCRVLDLEAEPPSAENNRKIAELERACNPVDLRFHRATINEFVRGRGERSVDEAKASERATLKAARERKAAGK